MIKISKGGFEVLTTKGAYNTIYKNKGFKLVDEPKKNVKEAKVVEEVKEEQIQESKELELEKEEVVEEKPTKSFPRKGNK